MAVRIRAYNVCFGDCILVSWDEADREHHAWVDFGNFHNDPNDVFKVVYGDVLARTGGRLDLLMITHRHLDHLEGFHTFRNRIPNDFQVDRVWHAWVTPATDGMFELASRTLTSLLPAELRFDSDVISRIYANNLAIATKRRMEDIAGVFPASSVFRIHRQLDLDATGARPPAMERMRIDVLAPEKESNLYLMPLAEHLAARQALDAYFDSWAPTEVSDLAAAPREATISAEADVAADPGADPLDPDPLDPDAPPQFLKLADFARLRRLVRGGGLDLLAAADKARNNTSIVTRWTYGDVSLLLTGDAELRSWDLIRASGAALGSTLLKVGHHGSINASPTWAFTEVFPTRRTGNAAVLSTDPTRYTDENEVPKAEVVTGWTGRMRWASRFRRTDVVPLGSYVEFAFPD
jgi:hypothetical protein